MSPFAVEVVPEVRRIAGRLDAKHRARYAAAVVGLKSMGCAAAGHRLLCIAGVPYAICALRLRAGWRLYTAFIGDGRIVIVWMGEHTSTNDPVAEMRAIFPGLADVGQRRHRKRPCCDPPQEPPHLDPETEDVVRRLAPARGN